jgi:hypothetical protein
MTIVYTIRYRRPDAPWSVAVTAMTGTVETVTMHVDRLRALGYKIHDITPPLVIPDAA